MKQTEIFYKVIDKDKIKITDIKNVLSLREIRGQFGVAVIKEYGRGARYFRSYLADVPLYIKKEAFSRQVVINSIISKKEFSELISIMKEAGIRLQKIIAKTKIVNGERLRQIIAETKIVNGQDKKSEGNNEKDSKSIWIQNLSDISLISMKEKINEELIKRDKLKNPLVTFMIHDDPIIKHFENISYREKKLNTLRKNFYRGDIKEVKVKIDIEKGQMIKEEDIIKPDCFGNSSHTKGECYTCIVSQSCYKAMKPKTKENKLERNTIPECFGTDKVAEECSNCKYFTECGQVYRKKLKEEKIAKEIRTIKI